MATTRRRTDGFSEDGLSYSVASDFDKQLGEALAEMEARRKDPRFIPGARVEEPDSPDLLRQEILEPLLMAHGRIGSRQIARQTEPKPILRTVGDDLVSFDPVTGTAKSVFTDNKASSIVPKNATERANWFQNSPLMQSEESTALEKLAEEGADAVRILGTEHPTLLKNAPYATRFGPIYRAASERRRRLEGAPVENIAPNTAALLAERTKLSPQMEDSELPPDVLGSITNRVADIDALLKPDSATGDNEELVAVLNPKGKPTRIRRSQLGKALKLGYRER